MGFYDLKAVGKEEYLVVGFLMQNNILRLQFTYFASPLYRRRGWLKLSNREIEIIQT